MFTIEEFLRISNQMRDYYAKKNNLVIYNRVVDKMKVVYPFYESVIIKKPKKVNA